MCRQMQHTQNVIEEIENEKSRKRQRGTNRHIERRRQGIMIKKSKMWYIYNISYTHLFDHSTCECLYIHTHIHSKNIYLFQFGMRVWEYACRCKKKH